MAIEIYDKAKVIKKDSQYFYMVKHGSKNSFTCPNQYIVGDDLRDKFIRRESRDSTWRVIATGGQDEHNADKIAYTRWNSPTGYIYGRVDFGNKKNIALALVKMEATPYESLDYEQQRNFDSIVGYSMEYSIDLANIPEEKKRRLEEEYCGTVSRLVENSIRYQGIEYWDLDNL